MNYPAFFQTATGNPPYAWQGRLACGDDYREDEATTQEKGIDCISRLIDIPTGLGKTAGTVLAWLWNQSNGDLLLAHPTQGDLEVAATQPTPTDWPRRLVYCLPMRTLVEQTEGEVRKWVDNLLAEGALNEAQKPRIVVLMGGEQPEGPDKDWDIHPEDPAILIGTQDMLLSRALNRGYGMSRYRWPMHFALLNNDCLWVMDEVQLMGPGLASTTQLEGFRNAATELGSHGCHSWWMSATIRAAWLKTVDMPNALLAAEPLQLSDAEKQDGARVEALRTASKTLAKATVPSGSKNLKEAAKFIGENRSREALNLVVVNTVKRARELHTELKKQLKGETSELLLLHSQFRPDDRQRVLDAIKRNPGNKIVVSTQVVEAGIDLSAHTLFTELAPWSSLVQRFGRCNRWLINDQHHYTDARIYWFDLPDDKDHPPYRSDALSAARDRLAHLSNAAIEHLEGIDSPDEDKPEFRHVIRRKDLVDLFDTTPDLAGADLDIDRFIRDAEDSQVRVFWRDWPGGPDRAPNGNNEDKNPEKAPRREELCSVPFAGKENAGFKEFLGKDSAYRWNYLDREWQPVKAADIYPGQTYLLHVSQGGYDQGTSDTLPTGWNASPKSSVHSVHPLHSVHPVHQDAYDTDPASAQDKWQTIAQHTDDVCAALEHLLSALNACLADSDIPALRQAARWHDWGKAHAAFQAKLDAEALIKENLDGPAAKAPNAAWRKGRIPKKPTDTNDHRRPHFRHELASALGVLLPDSGFPLTTSEAGNHTRDLAAYLIAAHHGKVRLSIRSLPDEWLPPQTGDQAECRFARGVWDGDPLAEVQLGGNTAAKAVTLSLEPMELGLGERQPFRGQPSWAERCLSLRDTLGPFKLAFLETLLRAADASASANPSQTND